MSRSVFRMELIFVCDAMKGVQLHSMQRTFSCLCPFVMKTELPVSLSWSDIS